MRSTTVHFAEGPALTGQRVKSQDGTETVTITGLDPELADKVTTILEALTGVVVETGKTPTTEKPKTESPKATAKTELSEKARAELALVDQQRALDRWAETGGWA